MSKPWQTGALVVAGMVGWMLAVASQTEAGTASQDQTVRYEYLVLYSSTAFSREKTPTGETRGIVTFNVLGAEGWEYAGSYQSGGDADTIVFKRPKKR